MLIRHFRIDTVRLPDPAHPGRVVFGEELVPDDTITVTYDGVTYEADSDGFFSLPHEAAEYFASRPGWLTPEGIRSEMRAGRLSNDVDERVPAPQRGNLSEARKGRKQVSAS